MKKYSANGYPPIIWWVVNRFSILIIVLFFCSCSSAPLVKTDGVPEQPTIVVSTLPNPIPTYSTTINRTPTFKAQINTPLRITPSSTTSAMDIATFSTRDIIQEGNYFLVDYSNSILENDFHLVNELSNIPFLSIKGNTWFGKALSPDGKYLVFSLGEIINRARLMALNLIDNSLQEVTNGRGCRNPSFAPDSQHLVADCLDDPDNSPQSGLYLLSLSGEPRIRIILFDTGYASSLVWSPDGRMVAFVHYTANGPQLDSYDPLYLLDTVCFQHPQTCAYQFHYLISANHYFWTEPIQWSPDSQNILILDGYNELRLINVMDGSTKNIVKTVDGTSGYSWSPDNQFIAYTEYWEQRANDEGKITIIPVGGGENRTITAEKDPDKKKNINLFDWIKDLGFEINRSYTVNLMAKDASIRETPALNGKVITRLQPKDVVLFINGPVNADYYTWWKIKVGDVEGWAQGIIYWYDAAE